MHHAALDNVLRVERKSPYTVNVSTRANCIFLPIIVRLAARGHFCKASLSLTWTRDLQAFAAGMAAASASLGATRNTHPSSTSNSASVSAHAHQQAARMLQPQAGSLFGQTAPQQGTERGRGYPHSKPKPPSQPIHDHPLPIPPLNPASTSHQRDSEQQAAWDQACREQQEYDYLHSLWKQHFQSNTTHSDGHPYGQNPHLPAPPQQQQQQQLPCPQEDQAAAAGARSSTPEHIARNAHDSRRQDWQHELLWSAFQQQQQQQQQQRSAEAFKDSAQLQGTAQNAPSLPPMSWPGLDPASPEAQAFVAAFMAYYRQAAGQADIPMPQVKPLTHLSHILAQDILICMMILGPCCAPSCGTLTRVIKCLAAIIELQ